MRAVVFEKAGEPREIGAGISLWANAMKALQKLGLYEAVLAIGRPLRPKGELRSPNGEVFYEVPAAAMEERFGGVTAVVHRADLQKTLHAALGEEAIRLGVEVTGFEQDKGGVVARFAGGREERCELLIGADGLHSVVREQLLDDGPPLRWLRGLAWGGGVGRRALSRRGRVRDVGPGRAVWVGQPRAAAGVLVRHEERAEGGRERRSPVGT